MKIKERRIIYRKKVMSIINKKFNKLTVIRFIKKDKKSSTYNWIFRCKCDCGKITTAIYQKLITGRKKSCGCMKLNFNTAYKGAFGESSFKSRYHTIKAMARKRGYVFKLSYKQFKKLSTNSCTYCGIKPTNTFHAHNAYGYCTYNGIDRVDNKKGYTTQNSVTCCSICNYAKRKLTVKEFTRWVKRIYNHLIKESQ